MYKSILKYKMQILVTGQHHWEQVSIEKNTFAEFDAKQEVSHIYETPLIVTVSEIQ